MFKFIYFLFILFLFFFKSLVNFFYYVLGKAAIDRMTSDMATELRAKKKSIAVLSIYPGLVRTEKALDRAKTSPEQLSLSVQSQSMCL